MTTVSVSSIPSVFGEHEKLHHVERLQLGEGAGASRGESGAADYYLGVGSADLHSEGLQKHGHVLDTLFPRLEKQSPVFIKDITVAIFGS